MKNISHVDTSSLALRINLANFKTEVDKLNIDKLVPVPTKITEIENKIPDINNLATKTALTTIENKIPETSNLAKKTDYNTKITDLENKIPDISNLATKTFFNKVENKIPDISNFATKTALTNLSNAVSDISTLIKKVTMIQKLEKLKTNMSVILDLTQN